MWHTENRIPRYKPQTTTKSIPKFSALRLKRSSQDTGYGDRKHAKLRTVRLVLGLLQVVGTVKIDSCSSVATQITKTPKITNKSVKWVFGIEKQSVLEQLEIFMVCNLAFINCYAWRLHALNISFHYINLF